MTEILSRRDTCALCDGRDLVLALPLAPSPIGDDFVPEERLKEPQPTYPLDVYLCNSCGHVQLLDILDPAVLYNDYIYVTTSSPGLVNHFDNYAEDVLTSWSTPHGSLIVDIGSNDGTLLKSFQSRGMKVLGVEPAQDIAHNATASGIETLPVFFNAEVAAKIKAEHGPAAIVTANNLFANVDALVDLTSGVRSLLAFDGVFVVETGYLADLIQNTVFDNIYHEHLGYHSVKPLVDFFSAHDMEMIHAQTVPTKGGSLRVTVQPAGGPRPVSPSIDQTISSETQRKVHCLDTFRDMGAKLDSIKARLTSLLSEFQTQGKSVAGYGASHSTTTLMYHLHLQDKLDFIFDDNPIKQGLFSPGSHVPVLAPQELYQRKPDYVVILAWRFSEAIIKSHQSYLEQGGHFIVPVPQVKVV